MSDAAPEQALLEARRARLGLVDEGSSPELTFASRGARVMLAGDAEPLVGALTGLEVSERGAIEVLAGKLMVLGHDVARGEHRKVLGVLPRDPVLTPRWRVRDYVVWAAKLALRSGAKAAADQALERLGLTALGPRVTHALSASERRGVGLAAALVGQPRLLLVDRPFANLDAVGQGWMASTLAELSMRGLGLVVATPQLATDGPVGHLLRGASDVLLFRGSELVAQGSPVELLGETQAFSVTITGGADALAERLGQLGAQLEGGPRHFLARLPEALGPSDLLQAAHRTGAVVESCVPLVGS